MSVGYMGGATVPTWKSQSNLCKLVLPFHEDSGDPTQVVSSGSSHFPWSHLTGPFGLLALGFVRLGIKPGLCT